MDFSNQIGIARRVSSWRKGDQRDSQQCEHGKFDSDCRVITDDVYQHLVACGKRLFLATGQGVIECARG
jgi:hypothetical protein